MKLGAIYRVVWLDAVSEDKSGWKRRSKIRKQKPAKIETVGWLEKKRRRSITLISSRDRKDCDGDTTIPRGMIRKMKRLK